jgi:dTDP-4-amino-4,6-dideoxygalactose transaminase
MIYWKGQIINPENFRIPSYFISPFSTEQLAILDKINYIKDENRMFKTIQEKFGDCEFTLSGKSAISKALSFYNLKNIDEVYIVTTTGNKYVSTCVTNEIEKHCKWSRELSEKTKLIFVIHEFGMIYKNMEQLIKLNIPIIEDLAMSLFSSDTVNQAGKYGDFTIYSLPKFFPLQYGGVLRYNKEVNKLSIDNSQSYQESLKKAVSYLLNQEIQIKLKRKNNYDYFKNKLIDLDIKTRLNLSESETPSVFMFSSDVIDLDNLKIFMQKNGVECSVFYGEKSFFLPVHQNLKKFDLDYIINLIKYFIYENK